MGELCALKTTTSPVWTCSVDSPSMSKSSERPKLINMKKKRAKSGSPPTRTHSFVSKDVSSNGHSEKEDIQSIPAVLEAVAKTETATATPPLAVSETPPIANCSVVDDSFNTSSWHLEPAQHKVHLKMAAFKAAEARAAAEKEEVEGTKSTEDMEKLTDAMKASFPSRTAVEREIRKLRKKIREAQRLWQMLLCDSKFEESQYEKLAKSNEFERQIEKLEYLLE